MKRYLRSHRKRTMLAFSDNALIVDADGDNPR